MYNLLKKAWDTVELSVQKHEQGLAHNLASGFGHLADGPPVKNPAQALTTAVGPVSRIGLASFRKVPCNITPFLGSLTSKVSASLQDGVCVADGDQSLGKFEEISFIGGQIPLQPSDLIVLAVSVVVTTLCLR